MGRSKIESIKKAFIFIVIAISASVAMGQLASTEPISAVQIKILSPLSTVYTTSTIPLKFSAEGAVLVGYSLDGVQKQYLVRARDAIKDEIKLVPVKKRLTIAASTGYGSPTDYVLISPDANILISLQKLGDGSASFAIVENKETKTIRRDIATSPQLQTGIDLELLPDFYIYATEINPSAQYVNLVVGRKSEEFSLSGTNGLFAFDLKVDAGEHSVKVFAVDKLGKEYSSSVSFSFKPERALPAVEIASPLNFVKVFNNTIIVSGTASSSARIEKVEIKVNDEFYLAEGTLSWKKIIFLRPGENVISVKVSDAYGESQTKSVIVYYIPPEKLSRLLAANITPRNIIAAELKNVSKFEGERYLINKDTSELRKAAIEIKPKLRALESKDAAFAAAAARRIAVKEYVEIKRNLSRDEKTKSGLEENEDFAGTFVEVEAENDTEVEWAIIKLYFSDDELRERKLHRDGLFIAWYDDNENSPTYGKWIKLREGSPPWVHDIGINKEENYIFANVSHFSIYALGGAISQETPLPTTAPPTTTQPPATQPPTITAAPQTSPPATTLAATSTPQPIQPSPVSEEEKPERPFSKIAFLVLLLVLIATVAFLVKKQKK